MEKTLRERLKELEGEHIRYGDTFQFKLDSIEKHVEEKDELIPRIHPYFTLHNIEHVKSVISNLNNFCREMDLLVDGNPKGLSKYEIFLLLAGAYLHDIGMIYIKDEEKINGDSGARLSKDELSQRIREEHPQRSAEYIEKHREQLQITQTDSRHIGVICKGHGDWELSKNDYDYRKDPTNTKDPSAVIRIRFLTALLQLADELDTSCERAPDFIRDVLQNWLDRTSRFHWMKHYYTGYMIAGSWKEGRKKVFTIRLPLNVPDEMHGKRMKAILENRIEKVLLLINPIVKQGCDCSFELKEITVTIDKALESMPEAVFRSYFIGDGPIKVLVIEDDKFWRDRFKESLAGEESEYSLSFADDEKSAVESLEQEHYNLVILDLEIPDKEGRRSTEVGYDLLKRINESYPDSIVIILSAMGAFDDIEIIKKYKVVKRSISKSKFYEEDTPKIIVEEIVRNNLHLLKGYVPITGCQMKSRKILIVDDDGDWQDYFSETLDSAGYATNVFATGEEGLNKLKTEHFDLVILDLRIPYAVDTEATMRSGIKILKEIKTAFPRLPVITVSAFATKNDREAVDSVTEGASLFIEKGKMSAKLLRRSVKEMLDKRLENF